MSRLPLLIGSVDATPKNFHIRLTRDYLIVPPNIMHAIERSRAVFADHFYAVLQESHPDYLTQSLGWTAAEVRHLQDILRKRYGDKLTLPPYTRIPFEPEKLRPPKGKKKSA